ncbi:MAG: hypothetical protein ACK5HT_22780, partial [Draconibacterium sp.]
TFYIIFATVKIFRNILVVLLAMIFLISSSGYVLYSSNCLCSGEKYTSIFVRPDTCETEFQSHHTNDTDGNEQVCTVEECHECNTCHGHHDECGCESPEVFFFKLKDKAINEEVKFLASTPRPLQIGTVEVPETLLPDIEAFENESEVHIPPPKLESSLEFLISIQQLKIPSLA